MTGEPVPPTPDLVDVVSMLESVRRLALEGYKSVDVERAYPSGTLRGAADENGAVSVHILHERTDRDWDRRTWVRVYTAASAEWPVPRDACGCGEPF